MAPPVLRCNLSFGIGFCLVLLCIFFPHSSEAQNVTSIVNSSIQCFNNFTVFKNCEAQFESSSNPLDAFCSSACLAESKFLLNCVNGILSNFNFYSPATVQAIDAAIKAFCLNRNGTSATSPVSPPTSGVSPKLAPSPSKAPSPSPSKAPSPSPSSKPAASHGGSPLKPHHLVPGIWAVGLLMFMLAP